MAIVFVCHIIFGKCNCICVSRTIAVEDIDAHVWQQYLLLQSRNNFRSLRWLRIIWRHSDISILNPNLTSRNLRMTCTMMTANHFCWEKHNNSPSLMAWKVCLIGQAFKTCDACFNAPAITTSYTIDCIYVYCDVTRTKQTHNKIGVLPHRKHTQPISGSIVHTRPRIQAHTNNIMHTINSKLPIPITNALNEAKHFPRFIQFIRWTDSIEHWA